MTGGAFPPCREGVLRTGRADEVVDTDDFLGMGTATPPPAVPLKDGLRPTADDEVVAVTVGRIITVDDDDDGCGAVGGGCGAVEVVVVVALPSFTEESGREATLDVLVFELFPCGVWAWMRVEVVPLSGALLSLLLAVVLVVVVLLLLGVPAAFCDEFLVVSALISSLTPPELSIIATTSSLGVEEGGDTEDAVNCCLGADGDVVVEVVGGCCSKADDFDFVAAPADTVGAEEGNVGDSLLLFVGVETSSSNSSSSFSDGRDMKAGDGGGLKSKSSALT